MLSVVLPSYNEEGMIKRTSEVLADLFQREQLEYELDFVNDGSRDNTWKEIAELSEQNGHIQKFRKRSSNLVRFGCGKWGLLCGNGLRLTASTGNNSSNVSFVGARIRSG